LNISSLCTSGKHVQQFKGEFRKEPAMMNAMTIQSTIRLHLIREGPCTLESLLTRLSQFSWSEIFGVVDQLSREGSLVLRRPTRFGYEVSMLAEDAQPSATLSCGSRSTPDDQKSDS
jgi:hypothetical protein